MSQTIKEVIEKIEGLIREAQMGLAVKALRTLTPAKLTRSQKLLVAGLARRASVPELSVRILQPLIRPKSSVLSGATDEEKAEYGASLVRIGAAKEAIQILESVDFNQQPKGKLYYVFALIANWEYEQSVPLLEELSQNNAIDSYSQLIAKVNLGSAYVFTERHKKAIEILEATLKETQEKNLHLLSGNILQFLAQSAIEQSDWRSAEKYLNHAEKLVADQQGIDSLFIRKWRAISELIQGQGKGSSSNALKQVKEEAIRRGHWETVRSCDFHDCIVTGSQKLFLHLYMGTPFESLRKKLVAKFPSETAIPEMFFWDASLSGRNKKEISLLLGKEGNAGRRYLKEGQALHRLLAVLSSDFYRSFRLATVYAAVFPNEYFNPMTSPQRVHQIVKRLKQFLKAANCPIEIVEDHGSYRLNFSKSEVRLLIPKTIYLNRNDQYFEKVRTHLNTSFTSQDVGKLLGLTSRRALFFLQQYVKEGKLSKRREGNETYYFLANSNTSQKSAA